MSVSESHLAVVVSAGVHDHCFTTEGAVLDGNRGLSRWRRVDNVSWQCSTGQYCSPIYVLVLMCGLTC